MTTLDPTKTAYHHTKYALLPRVPLSERPKGCANCPFGGIKVGSRGPVDSPFVIVGESPGTNELMKGYPFIGMSGEMLDQTLLDVGYKPGIDPEPYVLNALQCLPRQKDPAIMSSAARCCTGRLHDELCAHPRKVILALGAAASQSCTNDYSIRVTQDRGHLYKHASASIGTVITVHPAFLMRNGSFFSFWKKDLKYAVDLLHDIDPKAGLWSPPTWQVITTRAEYEDLVVRMGQTTHIAGDIETGGKDKYGVPTGLHHQKGYILNLGITSNLTDGNLVDIIPGETLWAHEDLTRRLFDRNAVAAKWIWQNGKFDIKFFRHEGIMGAHVDEDTMLLSYALNENKGHDLDSIAWDWIGAPKHKEVVEQWFASQRIARKNRDYALIPRPLLYQYAAYDISKTYKMFWPLREAVDNDAHSKKLYERTLIPASEMFTQVEMRGLKMDPQRVIYNDTYLQEQLIEPEQVIQGYATQFLGHPINIGSYQQLQKLMYDKMKLGPPGSSTDDDALIKIQRRFNHPISISLQRWRKIAKARNTYVKKALAWPGTDGRVHVTFKIHGTSTGRLATGDPTNLQNWPRDPQIRGSFVAEDGYILVECDLNQAELRCLALMSGDPVLLEIYRANEVSIHHITSVAMFGERYTDDEKMRAKAVNFGIVYGRTAPSLAEEFNISVREAEEYIRIWFDRYPVAKRFIYECRDAPQNQRNLITNFGRKKRWGAVTADNRTNLENEAANFPHQSTAHDITLQAGIEVQPVIKRVWQADIVNEIHDALYFETLDDPAIYGPLIAYVQHVMQRVPKDWGLTKVPFLAEAKIGTRWGAKRNAIEGGIRDPSQLAEYMTSFNPDEHHISVARGVIRREQERLAA